MMSGSHGGTTTLPTTRNLRRSGGMDNGTLRRLSPSMQWTILMMRTLVYVKHSKPSRLPNPWQQRRSGRGQKRRRRQLLFERTEGSGQCFRREAPLSASCAVALTLHVSARVAWPRAKARACTATTTRTSRFNKGKSKGKGKPRPKGWNRAAVMEAQAQWMKGKGKGKHGGPAKTVNVYAADANYLGDLASASTSVSPSPQEHLGMLDSGATASAAPELVIRGLISSILTMD